jgi:hypothetical protein
MAVDINQRWTRFWDTDHSVYVSARHLDSHYRHIADDIIRVLPRGGEARVLDHGCGEALHAGRIADGCAALYLCDAAPKLRIRLKERFAGQPRIAVLAPEAVEDIADASLIRSRNICCPPTSPVCCEPGIDCSSPMAG